MRVRRIEHVAKPQLGAGDAERRRHQLLDIRHGRLMVDERVEGRRRIEKIIDDVLGAATHLVLVAMALVLLVESIADAAMAQMEGANIDILLDVILHFVGRSQAGRRFLRRQQILDDQVSVQVEKVLSRTRSSSLRPDSLQRSASRLNAAQARRRPSSAPIDGAICSIR